jgi:heterodisulfide reductase subunit C2
MVLNRFPRLRMAIINLNDLDPAFKHEVAEQIGGQGIRSCFACKACTAACPIESMHEDYDPRVIIRMVLLGMKKEVLENEFIWLCSSCYSCGEVCPQDVKFTEVMYAIKNIAVKEGCVPNGLTMQKLLLRQHGRLYEVSEFENEKRAKLGLPPVIEHAEDYDLLLADSERS